MATGGVLEGVRVVELSSGIAGAYCTKLLSDAGAEVVKAEPPGGDPLRRQPEAPAPRAAGEDGALFRFLHCSQRSVVIEPGDEALLRRLIEGADIVVWSTDAQSWSGVTPPILRVWAPEAVVVAITAFGLDGPWRDRPSSELILQAWSGGMGLRGSPDRPPVSVGGRPGEWIAGVVGAVGALMSLRLALRSGRGDLVDVSTLESLAFTQVIYPVTFHSMAGHPMIERRSLNFPGVERTLDGWVGFMVVTGQQWLDFCLMVEQYSWMDEADLLRYEYRISRRHELGPRISAWMSTRTTEEILAIADDLRIPASPIGTGATVPTFSALTESGAFRTEPGTAVVQPAPPYRFSNSGIMAPPTHSPRLGEHTAQLRERHVPLRTSSAERPGAAGELALSGLTIVDLTANWAGPVVGQVCAAFGARVIHVEACNRPDHLRMGSIRPFDHDQWWEWAPHFQAANTNKLGLTLDLESPEGQRIFRRLVDHCGVVIENHRPGVMERWGLTYADLRATCQDLIMLRMPAYGLEGAWRTRGGYAQTVEQTAGLAWITGYPDQAPQPPNGMLDPIAGLHATVGLLLALEHRERTGQGTLVEAPMIGAALNIAAEQIVEFSAYGRLLTRQGNRAPDQWPQGVYHAAGGHQSESSGQQWVAISVVDDAQWSALRSVLDNLPELAGTDLDHVTGRRASADRIDTLLADWCARRSAHEAVAALLAAGVPAAEVVVPHEQSDVEQLVARGYFEQLDHPLLGSHPYGRFPARFEQGPARFNRRHAPLLGEHNDDVLRDILGLSDAEYLNLDRAGIIGRVVTTR